MSNIEQVIHDRKLTEQGRHEGMQWMRDHLIDKLNHDLESNECDCQCDALKDVVDYLTGELPESTHQHVWQTDNLSDTYETICGVCQAVKEDALPLSNDVDDQWCDTCGSELTHPCGCEAND